MRLIDADKLKAHYSWWEGEGEVDERKRLFDSIIDQQPTVEAVQVTRCKDCRWGREACGNIECFVDSNIPPEYHGYEWFCPNGERRDDE